MTEEAEEAEEAAEAEEAEVEEEEVEEMRVKTSWHALMHATDDMAVTGTTTIAKSQPTSALR